MTMLRIPFSLLSPAIAGGAKKSSSLRFQVCSFSPSEIPISSTADPSPQLTARERRKLRNERRENLAAASGNWREEVEERLMHKPRKADKPSWKDELNLDNLSLLGPQWWVVRVSRVTGQETAERLARLLARSYPELEFKVYFPAVKVKNKLKNGTYKVKPKPLFPGCTFLYCILNKEIHDFVRECDGIGGFIGAKVGNSKRQINKPKPVAADEMEAIFQQAKREQEIYDQSFAKDESNVASPVTNQKEDEDGSKQEKKPRSRSKKTLETDQSSFEKDPEALVPGSSIRVLSGSFMNYVGLLKKFDHQSGKANVGISMFGKEVIIQVESNEIVVETR